MGVLPFIDWDSESSIKGSSRLSSPTSPRNSRQKGTREEYLFDRHKVVSWTERDYEELGGSGGADMGGVKKFKPPLPSPAWVGGGRGPRAF